MTKLFTYHLFGLNLATPFPCPTLEEVSSAVVPEVTVVEGLVPEQLDSPTTEDDYAQVEPGRYLFRGSRWTGRFLVENGTTITFQRGQDNDDEVVAYVFMHAVLSALLRQRNLLVMHANTAVFADQAIAVSGQSGAGKSTTLATLLDGGWSMLADDLTVITLDESGGVVVLPGIPQMYLTADSIARLDADTTNFPRYPWRRMKTAVPTTKKMAHQPAPLQAIYWLEPTDRSDLHCQSIHGTEKFRALQDCLYGPMIAAEHPGLFPLLTAVLAQVDFYRIERPVGRWTAGEVAELMQNKLTEK